jgi:hypothetical protein
MHVKCWFFFLSSLGSIKARVLSGLRSNMVTVACSNADSAATSNLFKSKNQWRVKCVKRRQTPAIWTPAILATTTPVKQRGFGRRPQ